VANAAGNLRLPVSAATALTFDSTANVAHEVRFISARKRAARRSASGGNSARLSQCPMS
jgi:hypothetical protein